MSLIITIGREFGSGGRELGRRLADQLHIAYYDQEILVELEKQTPYCLEYIEQVTEKKPIPLLPIHYGMSFSMVSDPNLDQSIDIYAAQAKILKEMAGKSSCVIIGRCADEVLKEFHPIRLFVYADASSKMERCRLRKKPGEKTDDRTLAREFKTIDRNRAKYYEFYTGKKWGAKENYDLMINTSGRSVKELADKLAHFLAPLSD
ncbi:MAG TPA: cytidylate kinase-like family protein [Firmicutes bacterium]|nr:cytidylate kinase-like family protein [Bacillota bacterium]